METLEELKAIIAGKPDDLAAYVDESGDYLTNDDGEFQIWNSDRSCWEFVEVYALPMRSLSDIERIIELEEKLNSSETKKEECSHPMTTASYDHVTCDSCHMIRTDGGWGCASRRWFDNVQSAKFYEKNGFLPR